MARTIGIGQQDFADIRRDKLFYIDKTKFIKEWWESKDSVTLITRPRRFGKTLTMSMLEEFFSVKYEGKLDSFFGGLDGEAAEPTEGDEAVSDDMGDAIAFSMPI